MGYLNDWVPYPPLLITSVILLILFPIFSTDRRKAFRSPGRISSFQSEDFISSVTLLNVTHFVTSRYFINFLPLFFISLYLSLYAVETKFEKLRKWMRLRLLFVILFILSNMVILPLYYRSEKQNFRGLATYLKSHLRNGDKIFVVSPALMPGILHYFGASPLGRHHNASATKDSDQTVRYQVSFLYQDRIFRIYNSKTCCTQYVEDGSRLWIVTVKWMAKEIQGKSPAVLKGYFDGSFMNFSRFPSDASMYLFLWDPKNPNEKGIEMPIE